MQLRKIIYHFAAIPRLLGSELVVSHIVSKDLLEIFEVSARDQEQRKGVMEEGSDGGMRDVLMTERTRYAGDESTVASVRMIAK